jgi:hypothetical protein
VKLERWNDVIGMDGEAGWCFLRRVRDDDVPSGRSGG